MVDPWYDAENYLVVLKLALINYSDLGLGNEQVWKKNSSLPAE